MADPTTPPWANDPIVAPAQPAPPAFGSRPVIEGPPPEPKTSYRTLTPQEVAQRGLPPGSYQVSSEGQVSKVADAGADAQATKQQAMEATKELIQSVEKARGYVNNGAGAPFGDTATGGYFNVLKHSPVPTNATALDQTVHGEIQGKIFQNWMASLKSAAAADGTSAFGGRILQSEIPYVVNSPAALTPGSLTTPQFLGNLDQLENRAIRSAALLNQENPDDPKVYQKYQQMFAAPAQNNNGGTGGAPGPGGGTGGGPDGNDPVKAELTQRLQAGQDPSDIIHWLVSINRPPDKATIAAILANQGNQSPDVREGDVGHSLGVGLAGVAQGVGDVANLVSSPFVEGVNAIAGTHYNPDMGASIRGMLSLPKPQDNAENLAYAVDRYGTQGLALAEAAAAAAPRVIGAGARALGGALESFGAQPLTDSAAAASSGAAGEKTRQAGGGPGLQMAAELAAGVPTAAAGTAVNNFSREAAAVPSVVNAGKAEGVNVNRAMAYPQLTPDVIATGKTMTGAKVMGRDMAATGNQIQGRVQALKDGGTALEPYNLGDTAQNIGRRYIQQSGKDFQQQYGALRTAAGGTPIPANQSLAQVDAIIARLSKAPQTNAKEISYLQGVRSDLANGLDVESARDIGSKLSSDIAKGDVTFGKAEADVLGIRKAVSQDIANGLTSAGKPGVARGFQQVDKAYSDRMDFIQNTIQKLTGRRNAPLPPETAATRIAAWAKKGGDSSSLGRIMAQATPEERANVGATVLDSLGSTTAEIAKNIEKIPARARVILFGQDGAKSLQNIQQLATEHARVMRSLGGSPTALAGDARSWIMRLVFGGGSAVADLAAGGGGLGSMATGAATTAALTGAKMGSDLLSARALMSPKITGWLRSAPRSADPAAINAWYDRLKAIAVREPALAPEVQRIQDAIGRAANSNVTPSVAASGTQQTNQ